MSEADWTANGFLRKNTEKISFTGRVHGIMFYDHSELMPGSELVPQTVFMVQKDNEKIKCNELD